MLIAGTEGLGSVLLNMVYLLDHFMELGWSLFEIVDEQVVGAHDHVGHPEVVGLVNPIPARLCLFQHFIHECNADISIDVGLSDVRANLFDPLLNLCVQIAVNLDLVRPPIFHRLVVCVHLNLVLQAGWIVTLTPKKLAQLILENLNALTYKCIFLLNQGIPSHNFTLSVEQV